MKKKKQTNLSQSFCIKTWVNKDSCESNDTVRTSIRTNRKSIGNDLQPHKIR